MERAKTKLPRSSQRPPGQSTHYENTHYSLEKPAVDRSDRQYGSAFMYIDAKSSCMDAL